ncbi:MAG: M13 family metallopeptidase [Eubacteriales bacterium]|nr:M13 family metallopeptidase [Eubacteriales bacterium]
MKLTKRLMAYLLALSLVLGLSAAAFAETDITTGSPWLASSVQGAVKEDTPTSLKDDFYLYVNKDSLLSYEIEPGYSSAGVIPQRNIDNDRDISALFTDSEPESSDAKLAKDMYDLFLDWDSRNAQGVQPLKEIADAVEKLSSIEEMSEYYATVPYELQAILPFGFAPIVDYNDSSAYIMAVGSGALLLDDSAEYGELSEFGALMKEVWSEFTLYILGRLGYSEEEAARKLSNCFELETALAPYILTSEEYNEPDILDKINNVVSLAEFEKMQGNVPILQVLDLCGYERKENLILLEPAWLEAFKGIYDDEHLTLLKDYVIVHSALGFGEALDRECFVKYMESTNVLSGAEGLLEDEQYAAQYAMNTMYWQVSRLYCERYFTPQDKQNVSDIIHKVLNAYAEMLSGEDFISEQTKQKAIEKLDNMVINVLYPDDWTEYLSDDLSFASASEGGTLHEALLALTRSETKKSAEEFSEPVDRYKWSGLLPTTVNAFYDPTANSVNMLAAFCRGELYNADMPLEEQYAKIGSVVAHEISHSFDGIGSQFDKDGNYSEWWTEEDRAAFDAKIQKIADYADTIYCWDGTHINGSIITGEACADMGAMACMLHIAKSIEGFDYDLFFRSFAELWSYLRSYNGFLSRLKDEHPPEFYRVNATVQQFEEFYDCYGVEEGDGMYLAPEKRIAVW